MGKVSTHLGSRLVWLALGCGLGASKIIDGLQHNQIDQLISGLETAFFAALFMQPLRFWQSYLPDAARMKTKCLKYYLLDLSKNPLGPLNLYLGSDYA